ncbi:hypothetical protein PENTCL1PPCAC_13194, partial [Pristionchus entomophagus]
QEEGTTQLVSFLNSTNATELSTALAWIASDIKCIAMSLQSESEKRKLFRRFLCDELRGGKWKQDIRETRMRFRRILL